MSKSNDSFFIRARRHMSIVGLVVKGILHKARPIRECPKCGTVWGDGKCPNPECGATASWRQTNCKKPRCGSASALVFQSSVDKYDFFIFCPRCNKYELVHGLPPKPVRYVKKADSTPNDNINMAVDPNEPPPLGSIVPPTSEAEPVAAKEEKAKKASKPKAAKAVDF